MHGDDKEAFGGRPTNGGIMGIAPLGLLYPCDPVRAYEETFRNLYISTGTARSASALAASVVAASMKQGADDGCDVSDAIKAASVSKKKVEDRYWRNNSLYPIASLKAEQLLEQAAELGAKYCDPHAFKKELFELVVQPFFADGSETLAIAGAMFIAAGGDFDGTVCGCVNFGRDNDSSASVGGAAAGALCGASQINTDWVKTVEEANPSPLPQGSIRELADMLCAVTARRLVSEQSVHKLLVEMVDADSVVNDIDDKGKNSLHKAAAEGRTDDLLQLLLSGYDPDAVDNNGTTALHFAAWENHPECVRILLDHGADPEIPEGDGWTALHDAVRKEYEDIICLFLERMSSTVLEDTCVRLSGLSGDEKFLEILKLLKIEYVRLDSIGICGKGLLEDSLERGYELSTAFLRGEAADFD